MAKKMSGLGRGIDAIFLENTIETASETDIHRLRLSQIETNSSQPRKNFDEASLQALADSITEHGVLQPILVREVVADRYQIIAGERRYRAAKLAGLAEIPSLIVDADEFKAAEIALIENIQRENLNPLEEAMGYRSLAEQFSLTQEEISKRIGKSRSAIANALRLLDLPDDLLSYVASGELSAGHAKALLGIKDEADMIIIANKVVAESLSVRATEDFVRKYNKNLEKALEEEEKDLPTVNYGRELEQRMMSHLGRRVKISTKEGKKSVTLFYEDNEDLEELLRRLCGDDFVENS